MSRELSSGHAGALKELETSARNLSEAPASVRDGIAHLDDVITDMQAEIERVTEEGQLEIARIAEEGRISIANDERRADELTKTATTIEGKLRKVGVQLTMPLENPPVKLVVEGDQTRLVEMPQPKARR